MVAQVADGIRGGYGVVAQVADGIRGGYGVLQ